MSADGNQLLSWAAPPDSPNTDVLSIWDLSVSGWIRRACDLAGRNLTRQEWSEYVGAEPYQRTCPNFPAS